MNKYGRIILILISTIYSLVMFPDILLARCNSYKAPSMIIIIGIDASFSMNYPKEDTCIANIFNYISLQREPALVDIILFGFGADVIYTGLCNNKLNTIITKITQDTHQLPDTFRSRTDIVNVLEQIKSQLALDESEYKGNNHKEIVIVSDLLDDPLGDVPLNIPSSRLTAISNDLTDIARRADKIFIFQADPNAIPQYEPYLSSLIRENKLVIEPSNISQKDACKRIVFPDFWSFPRVYL